MRNKQAAVAESHIRQTRSRRTQQQAQNIKNDRCKGAPHVPHERLDNEKVLVVAGERVPRGPNNRCGMANNGKHDRCGIANTADAEPPDAKWHKEHRREATARRGAPDVPDERLDNKKVLVVAGEQHLVDHRALAGQPLEAGLL